MSSLSGGERNRLLLAKLFTRPANILVLDEPTNDLDIDTQELLEELLRDYPGTGIFGEPRPYVLDNVITQSIVFEGEGRLKEYIGGYQDYIDAKSREEKTAAAPKPQTAAPGKSQAQSQPHRGSFPIKSSASSKACPTNWPRSKPSKPI